MECELCHGTKVVHPQTMLGVFNIGPCPNCTEVVHEQYTEELVEIATSNGSRARNQGQHCDNRTNPVRPVAISSVEW